MAKNMNVLMDIGGVKIYVNDANYEHFKLLPKERLPSQAYAREQQEAVKQMMIFKMLQDKYD